MKSALFLLVLFVVSCQSVKKVDPNLAQTASKKATVKVASLENEFCPTVKEYITVSEYLKSKKGYYQKAWVDNVATQTSVGCKGAAMRFINVFELMVRSETYAEDAAHLGLLAAQSTDEKTKTFVEIFKKSFLKKYLDLDLASSIQLAKGLSFEYEGQALVANKDFSKIVQFCGSEKKLALSKPLCAKLAYRMARHGQKTKSGIYEAFVLSYNFMTEDIQNTLTPSDALMLTEELISVSPMAVYNFVKAYQYGVSKKGLDLGFGEAVKFARRMGGQSVRMPASLKAVPEKTKNVK